VLIAKAVFLLERGQTDRQTDATERPNHAGGYPGVGNKPNCKPRYFCFNDERRKFLSNNLCAGRSEKHFLGSSEHFSSSSLLQF